jgi:peptidoglycan L-alanyl-D-glutamate endopeptidase CwlK
MDIAALNQSRIAPLFPPLIEKANDFITQCAALGVDILITQSLRTWQEQDALYAQGRTTVGKIVTNARGGQSYHNFGLAYDIVPVGPNGQLLWDTDNPAWATAEGIGRNLGLELGADWTGFKDIPHYELTGGVSLQTLRSLYTSGDLSACWKAVSNALTNSPNTTI